MFFTVDRHYLYLLFNSNKVLTLLLYNNWWAFAHVNFGFTAITCLIKFKNGSMPTVRGQATKEERSYPALHMYACDSVASRLLM